MRVVLVVLSCLASLCVGVAVASLFWWRFVAHSELDAAAATANVDMVALDRLSASDIAGASEFLRRQLYVSELTLSAGEARLNATQRSVLAKIRNRAVPAP